MTEVEHPYQILPNPLRDALRDTLICGTVGWILTIHKDVSIENAAAAVMNLRYSHVNEVAGTDPLTGALDVNGIHLDLDYEFFSLYRLWGSIRGNMLQSRRRGLPSDPYVFAPYLSKNKFTMKQIRKLLGRWVHKDIVNIAGLADCGYTRPPHLNDAQRLFVGRGGEVRDLGLIDTYVLAQRITNTIERDKVRAVLFGGTARYAKDNFIPSMAEYGIDITKHYPVGKTRGSATLDKGTDLVLILHEWVSHGGQAGKDAAIALARNENIPWLPVSRKTALAVRTLKRHGFIEEDAYEEEDEVEAGLEEQVAAAAELYAKNPDASEAEVTAWVEDKTACSPLDDSIFSRAKAKGATMRKPEAIPEPEPEVEELPPEPEPEPVKEPEVQPEQLPPEDHHVKWQAWSQQRIEVLEEIGVDFEWGGEPYRVARCPALETTTGDANRDEGRLIVALWGEDEKVLIARRDRNVHEAAKAFMLSRGEDVEEGDVHRALTIETLGSETPVGIGSEAELWEEGDDEDPRTSSGPPLELVPMDDGPLGTDNEDAYEPLFEDATDVAEDPPPAAPVEEHPYATFERLRGELAAVMAELGFDSVTVTVDGQFNIKGKAL